MRYVEAIANLQTSKFNDTGDVDSDSDSEIEDVNGEAEEEPTQAAEEQAEPTPSRVQTISRFGNSTDTDILPIRYGR